MTGNRDGPFSQDLEPGGFRAQQAQHLPEPCAYRVSQDRIIDPERPGQRQPGGGRIVQIERMPEMPHALLRGGDRHGSGGHGFAHGHQEGIHFEFRRKQAQVAGHRPFDQFRLRHRSGADPDQVRIPPLQGIDVGIGRGAGCQAVQQRIESLALVEQARKSAEHLLLALVLHRIAGVVVDGRQRGVKPERCQRLGAPRCAALQIQPFIADGAAADHEPVLPGKKLPAGREAFEDLLERAAGLGEGMFQLS